MGTRAAEMHRGKRPVATGLAGVVLGALLVSGVPAAGAEPATVLPIRAELAAQLDDAAPNEPLLVLVTGDSTDVAVAAVDAAGLTPVEVFDRLSIVAAAGPADAVRAVHAQPGVRRVDANLPLTFLDDVAHRSTGVAQLRDSDNYPQLRRVRRRDKTPYDGTGVSIAVVDTGFDPAHEQFVEDGETKFDVHIRQACALHREVVHYVAGTDPVPADCSAWVPAPAAADDRQSGHGTIIAGVAAGYPRSTPHGAVSGTAPGARLVGLSIGSAGVMYNAVSALNWVLEHHADPCGDGSCPPIRVVNNSYGLRADDVVGLDQRSFDPDAPMSVAATKLIEAGVVVVFAAGNDGGDGSDNRTNFLALHPLPGFLTVGAYDDANSGDRDVDAAHFSARGRRGDPSTYPDLLAPGASYLMGCALAADNPGCVASPDGATYGSFNGTSASAPYVAGTAAQLFEADSSLKPAQVENFLEDSAYQGFIPDDLLEADTYLDPDGNARGNDDHPTSFHAGHGLVDAVGALGALLRDAARPAPEPCGTRNAETTITDPAGDATLAAQAPSPVARPGFDIVGVAASLLEEPGALTVTVTLDDLPEADPHMHLTVAARIDGGYFEVDFDRSLAGDGFTVFTGEVEVEGSVDPDADTVTFVIRPTGGAVQERASLRWAWTANTAFLEAEVDFTEGACTIRMR